MTAAPGILNASLSHALTGVSGGGVRHAAAAIVDLGDREPVRIGVRRPGDERHRFEIGSISKGLTGMLCADAIARGEVRYSNLGGALCGQRWRRPPGPTTRPCCAGGSPTRSGSATMVSTRVAVAARNRRLVTALGDQVSSGSVAPV
jgi:hypothetical protein